MSRDAASRARCAAYGEKRGAFGWAGAVDAGGAAEGAVVAGCAGAAGACDEAAVAAVAWRERGQVTIRMTRMANSAPATAALTAMNVGVRRPSPKGRAGSSCEAPSGGVC